MVKHTKMNNSATFLAKSWEAEEIRYCILGEILESRLMPLTFVLYS